jgi:hypothetical protein
MMTGVPNRRGVALLAAIALMILVGLLLAGVIAATAASERSTRLAQLDAGLDHEATFALETAFGDARTYDIADLGAGESRSYRVPIAGALSDTAIVTATRLRGDLVWLVANVSTARGDARRRVSLVARYPSLGVVPLAALTSHGDVTLNRVTFAFDSSGDASCLLPRTGDVVTAFGATVGGDAAPVTLVQTSAGDSVAYGLTSRQLAQVDSADARGMLGAIPVTRVHGDTSITGGELDGVIIADGAIAITGPFSVHGLLIARGVIRATSGGFTLVGGAMSFATSPGPAIDVSDASLTFSPCTIARVLRRAFRPVRVHRRSWAELF